MTVKRNGGRHEQSWWTKVRLSLIHICVTLRWQWTGDFEEDWCWIPVLMLGCSAEEEDKSVARME